MNKIVFNEAEFQVESYNKTTSFSAGQLNRSINVNLSFGFVAAEQGAE